MKKLQSLGKSLSRLEQQKILGGYVDPGENDVITHGECDSECNNVGSWSYTSPATLGQCRHDIYIYCWSNRGYCNDIFIGNGVGCA